MGEFKSVTVERHAEGKAEAPSRASHEFHEMLNREVSLGESIKLSLDVLGRMKIDLNFKENRDSDRVAPESVKVNGIRVFEGESKQRHSLNLDSGAPVRIEWVEGGHAQLMTISVDKEVDMSVAEVKGFRKLVSDEVYNNYKLFSDNALVSVEKLPGIMEAYQRYGTEKTDILLKHFLPQWLKYEQTRRSAYNEFLVPALRIDVDCYEGYRFRGFGSENASYLGEEAQKDSANFINAFLGKLVEDGTYKVGRMGLKVSLNPVTSLNFDGLGLVVFKSDIAGGMLGDVNLGENVIFQDVKPSQIVAIMTSFEAREKAVEMFKGKDQEIKELFGKDITSLLVPAWHLGEEEAVLKASETDPNRALDMKMSLCAEEFKALNGYLGY